MELKLITDRGYFVGGFSACCEWLRVHTPRISIVSWNGIAADLQPGGDWAVALLSAMLNTIRED